ncbi:MAG: FHA domain-containing protein [bacterium]|nr:FHA domain-containing protein [bacterium]
MTKVNGGKIENTIEGHLKAFKRLADQRSGVEKRLETAVREKGSVKESIFRKVAQEYRDQIDALDLEIYPLAEVATESLIGITKDHETIERTIRGVQDEIDEHAFRHKVGEFDDEGLENATAKLHVQLDDLEEKRRELAATIEALQEVVVAGTPKADPLDTEDVTPPEPVPNADPTPPQAPAPPDMAAAAPRSEPPLESKGASKPAAEPAVSQGDTATTATAEGHDDGSLNTNEWVEEFFAEGNKRNARATNPQGPTMPASPSPSTSPAGAATFPILVVTKGAGAGKKLPLVPMTMTIGREHDNNIELKDEDVARYHARISYERGHYILQDLDSSSGTWVNDEKITTVQLKHGDKILVGSTEMLVDFPQ